jgi:LysM repeat protein
MFLWISGHDRVMLDIVGRLIGLLVLLVVLYAIITQPVSSAAMVRSGLTSLSSAGTSLTHFTSSVVTGNSSYSRSSSSSSTGGTYRVRSGDTLSSIAAAHGTSVSALAARNGIANSSHIVVGQRLSLG